MSEYRVPPCESDRVRRQLYSLAIEGKQISKIAAISRIRRVKRIWLVISVQKYVTIFAKFSAILK